jgi:hypothetical protein
VSRPRRKREPVKLARVLQFDRISRLCCDEEAEAHKDYFDADDLAKSTPKKNATEPQVAALRAATKRALKSVIAFKALLEDQLGGRFPVTAQNAKVLSYLTFRIRNLTEWDDWCVSEEKRFAPDATLYNLAEFRRFRNRVVGKGAAP